MAYYLIAAGGTGAKCANAFIHLCAAGLMANQEQDVQVYMVDADTTNGNRNTTLNAISLYQEAQKNLSQNADLGKSCPIFKTPVIYNAQSDRHNLNFLEHYSHNLEAILNIRSLPKEHQALFKALYTQEKREEARFQNGFLGWPSVGSAIISSAYEQIEHLADRIAADTHAKVLLMGSIFGGTGAASIPTLAKLLHRSFRNQEQQVIGSRSLGMVLMLPYFDFDNSEGEKTDQQRDNPNIDPNNFALKTKIALRYYYNHDMHKICSRIYLLGDSLRSKVASKKQIGGVHQNNKSHYMELYAGLAAIDFFGFDPSTVNPSADAMVYHETCRRSKDVIQWADLPHVSGPEFVYNRLHKATSCAYAYNAAFAPLFRSLRKGDSGAVHKFPWYAHLITQAGVDLKARAQASEAIHSYYLNYLHWLRELHLRLEGDSPQIQIELFDHKSLENYLNQETAHQKTGVQSPLESLSKEYTHLVKHMDPSRIPPKGGLFRASGFDLLRKNLNNHKLAEPAQDLGVFFNALYHCSL